MTNPRHAEARLKLTGWLVGVCLLLSGPLACLAQPTPPKIVKIEIKHIGPSSVSDELIRANIRLKAGDDYLPAAVDEDVRNLYATGLFYDIRVGVNETRDGVIVTYAVQANPRLVEIRFSGNKRLSDAKLRKAITSKVGDPLNERKLFTDTQEIQKLYQKKGYPRSEVKYVFNIEENAGRATASFEIKESPKVKIKDVQFVGAKAFTQRRLRRVIKTRRHWMFSWITGSGVLKDEQFEEDKDKLAEFYRDHGYLDFEIKKVEFLSPTPRTLLIRFLVYEGTQYRVGAIKFSGNKLFSTSDVTNGLRSLQAIKGVKAKIGPHGLT